LFFDLQDQVLQRQQVVDHYQGVARQVIQQAGGGGVEDREVEFTVFCKPLPILAHPFVGRNQVLAGGGEQQALRRGNCCLSGVAGFESDLGFGVEAPQGVDLIAEEIQARRVRIGGRPDIQDASPPGKLTGTNHGIDRLVPEADQQAGNLLRGNLLPTA